MSFCSTCGAYWDCEHQVQHPGLEEIAPDGPTLRDELLAPVFAQDALTEEAAGAIISAFREQYGLAGPAHQEREAEREAIQRDHAHFLDVAGRHGFLAENP